MTFAAKVFISNLLILISFCSVTAQVVSWTKDIAPIIYENCSSCHHDNGIAPFSLMTYDQVKTYAHSIRIEVIEKKMPPWPADPNFMHFVGEANLEQSEIDAINTWVNADMPFGNPNDEPDPPMYSENGSLLEIIDHIVKIEPYEIQSNEEEYRWFAIENPFTETVYLNQLEVKVGLESIVHHADLFLDLTGSSMMHDQSDPLPGFNSSTGFPTNDYYINAWQPGGNIAKYPRGWGVAIPPEADFVIEIHYGPDGIGLIDSTIMNLKFVAEQDFERSIRTGWLLSDSAPVLVDGPLIIPANQEKTFHQESLPLPSDLSLISICPHMHLLGKSYKVWFETPQGDSINLINIPKWDFHWQKYYTFQSIMKIPAGSILKSEGVYDNTINNHDNPNSPPQTVSGGPFTTDEMFLCYFIFAQYEDGDEEIVLDPSLITNIKEPKEKFDYSISPNPTDGNLLIDIGSNIYNDLTISIFDAQSKLQTVKKLNGERISINVDELQEGIYFLKLENSENSKVKKFVKY